MKAVAESVSTRWGEVAVMVLLVVASAVCGMAWGSWFSTHWGNVARLEQALEECSVRVEEQDAWKLWTAGKQPEAR